MKLSFVLLVLAATLATTAFATPIKIYRNSSARKQAVPPGSIRNKELEEGNPDGKPEKGKHIPAQAPPGGPEKDCGLSCNTDNKNLFKGEHLHSLETNDIPPNSGFKATEDGDDGNHPPGHVTLKTTQDMNKEEVSGGSPSAPFLRMQILTTTTTTRCLVVHGKSERSTLEIRGG
ncbi:hypothetical protein IE81DRAFT_247244 [Ceraceosorus guamensis]|uniref:Superoxide dismutase copper/zinc binding domain-containing protein n=1 Tax=Ceraceosorus guamensis TaxID=1522189 RepID=A0A316VQV6_9BASI|nr:hypothetical protein IE81DRAFT_247244 [Ceraceosorus guamensis]PWN39976.1 hypothetical protein IE81DRAFT_247244 [Ceraceosorus guamensis]